MNAEELLTIAKQLYGDTDPAKFTMSIGGHTRDNLVMTLYPIGTAVWLEPFGFNDLDCVGIIEGVDCKVVANGFQNVRYNIRTVEDFFIAGHYDLKPIMNTIRERAQA